MTKLIVVFRNFADAPKTVILMLVVIILKNFVKLRLNCVIKNCYIILVRCKGKGHPRTGPNGVEL